MANIQLCQSFLLPAMLVVVGLFPLLPTANARGSNATDMRALLEFKSQITDDPLGVLTSWNSSFHFCLWNGVSCGRKHQRVTGLYLSSSKLGGSISHHTGNLSFLRVLDISNNSFKNDIPLQLGRLQRLQKLSLENNSLSGEIPSNLSNCSFLVYLGLRGNKLVGKIPAEISQLTKLQSLLVGRNNLTGFIPSSFGNLSSISVFSVADNSLTGSIPETLGQLRNMEKMSLPANHFSGIVPSSIFNLTSIQVLSLTANQLQGHISSLFFTSLKKLEFLSLADNQFSGSIPSSISNASNIITLQISANRLEGKVPSFQGLNSIERLQLSQNNLGGGGPDDLSFLCSLTNASSLEMLAVTSNNLGGTVPQCIGNLSSSTLRVLNLDDNQIHGSIPSGIGNLANLTVLYTAQNKFSGNIPQSIGNLQYLVLLYTDYNLLSGPIPEALGNLTNLVELDISDNNLHGAIPPNLANCRKLQVLDLSRNNLSGAFPAQVMGLSSLTSYLGFTENRLTGSLPEEISSLGNLRVLDAGKNMLSGKIPGGLGKCTSLELINLGMNYFQGTIPSSLSALRDLQKLSLYHNNLSGPIPDFFASFMFFVLLDLAFNDLEGMVPTQGVFRNATATSLEGNTMLCGGIPDFHLPPCDFRSHGQHKGKKKIIIASVSAVVGVTTVWLVVFLLRGRKKKVEQASSNSENSILNVSYHDLYKATDGFSAANMIGVGTFGFVYKGVLLNDTRQLIAVKVINLIHHGAVQSFLAECEALKNIRHRNLVKILSACSSIDHRGHDFKALVYEFMVNGSLEEWLHPPAQARNKLTLGQRVNISIDVASALEYLHFESGNPLVHCDIKPSNVLLDDELVAHVSDFGIAKFLPDGSIHSATNSSSLGLRGTIGYAPPEYGLGSKVSTDGDVYSYGILLLELFTGKRPTDEMFQDGWSLRELAKRGLVHGVAEIIDPDILEEVEASTSSSINANRNRNRSGATECLISIIEIGVACSAETPAERIMKMSQVTPRLRSIKSKFVRHC